VDWEVSQKTVQRDIDYLRYSLGAPMEYDRVRKGYYYTDKNWFLPALNVSESELRALLLAKVASEAFKGIPLAKELDRMLTKVLESMPERLPFPPELIFSRFTFVSPAAKTVNPNIWSTMVSGLLGQQAVQVQYRSLNTGKATERVIDPYHLANLHGEWYVFGWCHEKKTLRQFGIPQIHKAVLLTKTFKLPDTFDPRKLLSHAFRRQVLGEKMYKVKLRFDKSVAARVMERQWHPRQKIKSLANGAVELTFQTSGLFEVSRWVLSWGQKVSVLQPPSLRALVAREMT
jgi:predicted DNA-binding transcriptional regulator YafY